MNRISSSYLRGGLKQLSPLETFGMNRWRRRRPFFQRRRFGRISKIQPDEQRQEGERNHHHHHRQSVRLSHQSSIHIPNIATRTAPAPFFERDRLPVEFWIEPGLQLLEEQRLKRSFGLIPDLRFHQAPEEPAI